MINIDIFYVSYNYEFMSVVVSFLVILFGYEVWCDGKSLSWKLEGLYFSFGLDIN